MEKESAGASASNDRGSSFGVLSFVSAVVAAGSVAMVGFTSFTAFNPPGWIRIGSMAPLPVALTGSIALGLVGFRKGSGRPWALSGLILSALVVAAFIIMISIGG